MHLTEVLPEIAALASNFSGPPPAAQQSGVTYSSTISFPLIQLLEIMAVNWRAPSNLPAQVREVLVLAV